MSEQNPLLSFASHVTDLSKDLRQTLQAALVDKRCTQPELKELLGKIEALEPIAVEFEEVIHSLSDTLKPLREAKRTLVSATAVIDPRGRPDVGIAFMRITRALERMRTRCIRWPKPLPIAETEKERNRNSRSSAGSAASQI